MVKSFISVHQFTRNLVLIILFIFTILNFLNVILPNLILFTVDCIRIFLFNSTLMLLILTTEFSDHKLPYNFQVMRGM